MSPHVDSPTVGTASVGLTGFYALIGAAFVAPFSLPGGRALLAIALILLVLDHIRLRRIPELPPVAWLALAWIALACIITLNGVHPELGGPRLRKLFWFSGIPVTALLIVGPQRLRQLVTALAAGGLVLALDILVTHPLAAREAMAAGRFDAFWPALVDAGSMTDGQRLVVCILATLAVIVWRRHAGRGIAWPSVALVLQGCAMVVNFKRGSWISLILVVGVFLALRVNWRMLLLLGAVVAGLFFVPAVQERLGTLRDEFGAKRGGRMLMWREIAPALIKAHPWGIGYRSLTNDMMREIAPGVEPDRDHLHSNTLQVLVATGWLGWLLYTAWMLRALWDGWGFFIRGDDDPEGERTWALTLTLMLLALLVNGVVEYNFGDAELVLLYAFIMGAAAAGIRRVSA